MERIFLDHASTTPVDPRVREAMEPYFARDFANPSALYAEAVSAKEAVENARIEIARLLHARANEIVFCGSGTESDNLAVLGAVRRAKANGIERPHVVTTVIEHPAVLEACRAVEREGGDVTRVGVSEEGIASADDIAAAMNERTVLVTVMQANNEIGTIQPVSAIGRAVREFKENKKGAASAARLPERQKEAGYPYFHVDASQSANYLDAWVDKIGCDLLTLDGSKIYGPKGVGVLYARKGTEIEPLMYGGGQERSLRPATENVPGIVGFAKALSIAVEMRETESERLSKLRDRLIGEVLERFPGVELNGSRTERLPNNANFCIPGANGEFLVIKFDRQGVMCSSASACRSLTDETYSYVIEALGKKECASSSIRFTFGRGTKESDIERLHELLGDILK